MGCTGTTDDGLYMKIPPDDGLYVKVGYYRADVAASARRERHARVRWEGTHPRARNIWAFSLKSVQRSEDEYH